MGLHRAGRQEAGAATGTQERGSFCRGLRTEQGQKELDRPRESRPYSLKAKENPSPQAPEFLELRCGSKVIDT